MGDPCGIGPEIIAAALADSSVHEVATLFVIGDKLCMERGIDVAGTGQSVKTLADGELPDGSSSSEICLLERSSLSNLDIGYSAPTAASGDAVYRYITTAAELCLSGRIQAMATAPINKKAMNLAGHDYPGHTELLAELTGAKDFVMMLAGSRLRVTLVTIHESLAEVPRLVTFHRVLSTIMTTHRDLSRYFVDNPRIAVLSLNPHAGEGGMFGMEEELVIAPAIAAARGQGVNACGPHSADTLFHFAATGAYDAVVCMYHDQGLIPLKLLHFEDGVNITLGLPIIRSSVDHGTAYDLAGKGIASCSSMKAAIMEAASMAVKARGEK